MCVEGSQPIVHLRGALKRGVLAKKGHLKRLRPPATACDRGHPQEGEMDENMLLMCCGAHRWNNT